MFQSIHQAVGEEISGQTGAAGETPGHVSSSSSSPQQQQQQQQQPGDPIDYEKEYHLLQARLREREVELQRVQEELRKLREQPGKSAAAAAAAEVAPVAVRHKGKWVLDPVLQSFFQLEESVKAELRREKARRLLQVNTELQWIPVVDDPAQLKGTWSCCNQDVYNGPRACNG